MRFEINKFQFIEQNKINPRQIFCNLSGIIICFLRINFFSNGQSRTPVPTIRLANFLMRSSSSKLWFLSLFLSYKNDGKVKCGASSACGYFKHAAVGGRNIFAAFYLKRDLGNGHRMRALCVDRRGFGHLGVKSVGKPPSEIEIIHLVAKASGALDSHVSRYLIKRRDFRRLIQNCRGAQYLI